MNEFKILRDLLIEHLYLAQVNEGQIALKKLTNILEDSKLPPKNLEYRFPTFGNPRGSEGVASTRKYWYGKNPQQKQEILKDFIKPEAKTFLKNVGTTPRKLISTIKHGIPDQTEIS